MRSGLDGRPRQAGHISWRLCVPHSPAQRAGVEQEGAILGLTQKGYMSKVWARLTHLFVATCGTKSEAGQIFSPSGRCDNRELLWLRRLTPSVIGVGGTLQGHVLGPGLMAVVEMVTSDRLGGRAARTLGLAVGSMTARGWPEPPGGGWWCSHRAGKTRASQDKPGQELLRLRCRLEPHWTCHVGSQYREHLES